MHPSAPPWYRLPVIVLFGLLALGALAWVSGERFLAGRNDFFALYPGGRLAFDPNLYDKAAEDSVQAEAAHWFTESVTFTRLPFYAVMLWPLGRLSYLQAYSIFLLLSFSSLIAFIVIWRPPSTALTLEASCLFLPGLVAIVNGQDVLFLLLVVCLAVRLEAAGKRVAAGALLALGAIKIHLFLLVPLLILAGGFWSVGFGYALGGLSLIAISFAAQGRNWPANFYHVVTQAAVSPSIEFMPNLHNLCLHLPFPAVWQGILTAAVIAASWLAVRRSSFVRGMGIILCAGLLIGHHAYLPDCSLLRPVFLGARSLSAWPLLRTISDIFLKPFLYLPIPAGADISAIVTGLFRDAGLRSLA
jgi:Glycosyltransferase family 87